ncbi:hypothetical protein LZ30DRAFT_303181 [Colletotrichum cereale]|nr:hypothetical protein LZ30DRAFT_303181 [Colletotrichum cereale]
MPGCVYESSLNSQGGAFLCSFIRESCLAPRALNSELVRINNENSLQYDARMEYQHADSLNLQQPIVVSDIADQQACAVEPSATVQDMPASGAAGGERGGPLMPAEIGPLYCMFTARVRYLRTNEHPHLNAHAHDLVGMPAVHEAFLPSKDSNFAYGPCVP